MISFKTHARFVVDALFLFLGFKSFFYAKIPMINDLRDESAMWLVESLNGI